MTETGPNETGSAQEQNHTGAKSKSLGQNHTQEQNPSP